MTLMAGESVIQIVRVDQMMLIGELQMGNLLKNPRLMIIQPAGNGQVQILISKIVGDPDSMNVNPGFSYFCKDQGILDAYRENVSGLVMARTMPPNVLKMGGQN